MGILAGGVQFSDVDMPKRIRAKAGVGPNDGYTKETYGKIRLLIYDMSTPTLTDGPPAESTNEPEAPIPDDDYDL